YRQYRQKKDKSVDNSWWDNLPEMLQRLAKIMDIPAILNILQTPQSQPIQNLILIPHRDLHRFPLHALFNREENGQNFTISYLPSAQFSLKPPTDDKDEPSPQQLLSVEVAESENLPPLSFVAFEAEAITQLFENPQRIQEKDATKDPVEVALENKHQIFHFAGHGNYNFAEPLNSELALAKDDKLTLRDIYDKKLGTYQLVSLSACETAITGNQTITTEYVGLVSGFLSRGVSRVVSTLWTVKSAATALVMIEFYRRWQAGKSGTSQNCINDSSGSILLPGITTSKQTGITISKQTGITTSKQTEISTSKQTEISTSKQTEISTSKQDACTTNLPKRDALGKSEVQALAEATKWLKNLTVEQLKQWYQTFRNQLPREEGRIRPFLKTELGNLATMEPNSKPYEHPYYWAAFIITGKL
ncbi:MAG: CHAT domain-containing protein, partial [Symploca sp. SIO3E6]|nr:CHAT domain-containing protein [Caldora sp. SIO3E6]